MDINSTSEKPRSYRKRINVYNFRGPDWIVVKNVADGNVLMGLKKKKNIIGIWKIKT